MGVTGHRPPKLSTDEEPKLREAVRQVILFVQTTTHDLVKQIKHYDGEEPILRIISPLAEGADRLVAEEGLTLGFKLHCPLPASREEYRHDFKTKESSDAFDQLLLRADAVFELDGQRAGEWLEPVAYESVGRMTLSHSDVLIAIWDGDQGAQGGTGQTVREARQAGVCTIRIDLRNPLQIECHLPWTETAADWQGELRKSIKGALLPPESAVKRALDFLQEPFTGNESDPITKQRDQADRIAGRYARRYRGAYKAIYALATLAVLFAVGGLWLLGNGSDVVPEWLLPFLELLCIGAILSVILWGNHAHWHERWLDARMLAEQFRTWAFLAPIGQTPSTSRLPPYVSPEAARLDWTGWYLRARVREQGLLSVKVTSGYLEKYRHLLLQAIEEQVRHHSGKGQGRKRTYERIEFAAVILFSFTALACVFHLKAKEIFWLTTLGAITAALPALGAALEGASPRRVRRLAERAEGMQLELADIHKRLEMPETKSLTYIELAQIAHEASAVMLDELSDWRNLVRVRTLHL